MQYRNYKAELEIFTLNASADSESLCEVITFLSHVAPCYPEVRFLCER